MQQVVCLDSGEWVSNDTEISAPRPYSVLSEMGIRVKKIAHLPYSRERKAADPILHEKSEMAGRASARPSRLRLFQRAINQIYLKSVH